MGRGKEGGRRRLSGERATLMRKGCGGRSDVDLPTHLTDTISLKTVDSAVPSALSRWKGG
jgi:hypothetical protein